MDWIHRGQGRPSTRGARIETNPTELRGVLELVAPPRGGRGLKHFTTSCLRRLSVAPPRGGRGLKLTWLTTTEKNSRRPSTRGARIETGIIESHPAQRVVAPPRGGRGLKHRLFPLSLDSSRSPLHAGGAD